MKPKNRDRVTRERIRVYEATVNSVPSPRFAIHRPGGFILNPVNRKNRFTDQAQAVIYLKELNISVIGNVIASDWRKHGSKVFGAVDYLVNHHKFIAV